MEVWLPIGLSKSMPCTDVRTGRGEVRNGRGEVRTGRGEVRTGCIEGKVGTVHIEERSPHQAPFGHLTRPRALQMLRLWIMEFE